MGEVIILKTEPILLEFENEYKGVMTGPRGQLNIGEGTPSFAPYHLLYGALGSCFYSNFLNIAKKKRLHFDKATIQISGEKRDQEVPTLKTVTMLVTIYGGDKEEQLRKSVELGAKYCSIHETIGKVAEIAIEVLFK